MPNAPRVESRFYAAIAMITLPVVIIAISSVALGGRSPEGAGLFGGMSPVLIGELVCLGPVFLGGVVLALWAATREPRRED